MAAEPADEEVERHVRKRFEVCQRLGKGAYGVVWKAIERRSRSTVLCGNQPVRRVHPTILP